MKLLVGTLAALAVGACSAPEQVILPGQLDLPVAEGDVLKLCPDDGVDDTTPNADCVLGPPSYALAPYAATLKKRGWKSDGPLFVSPDRTCVEVQGFQTNVTKRERTLLEFRFIDPSRNPEQTCPSSS